MTVEPTEVELQTTIVDAARVYGWLAVHFRPARTARGWRTPLTGDPGFPDLVLARPGRVLALELKSARGRPGPGQAEWLAALDRAVVTAELVRPADLDRILDLLRPT